MSLAVHTRNAVLCIVALAFVASPAFAQRYGQNPAPGGFVPFADGPVPADTTGTANSDTNASGSTGGTNFTLGNNTMASLSPGHITLTFTNNASMGGLYNLFAALGNLDFIFESMTGADIRVTSLVSNNAVVVDFNFSGSAGMNNSGDNDGSNDVPDANPADDNMNTTGDNDSTDTSPGNPFAN